MKVQIGNRDCLFSRQDEPLIQKYRWGFDGRYIVRRAFNNGKTTKIYLHREILAANVGQKCDHANGNKLDNRRENLRFCSNSQNSANRPRISKLNKFKGVRRQPLANTWMARLKKDYVSIYLGTFKTAEAAAKAYNQAAKLHFGDFAVLNKV